MYVAMKKAPRFTEFLVLPEVALAGLDVPHPCPGGGQ